MYQNFADVWTKLYFMEREKKSLNNLKTNVSDLKIWPAKLKVEMEY